MARYIWLSHVLSVDDPRPPAIPAPELEPFMTVKEHGAAVQVLRTANHIGTHVDSPCHVVEGGVRITDFEPGEFIFTKPAVVDLDLADEQVVQPEHLEPHEERLAGADIALFRFGYDEVRRSDPARYSASSPGFGLESAQWLRDRCPGLCAMGMDVPSLATIASLENTMRAHNVLLEGEERRFLVVEEMVLDEDLSGLNEVRLNPWLVNGMDSGPCSVVGVVR